MAYTRNDLIAAVLSNLGIVRTTDTSASLTRVALVSAAAKWLGVLPSGQTLSAEDSATIDARVPTVIADLASRRVVTIANPNSIPGGMFDALSHILANAARGDYESGANPQLATEAAIAERKLYNFGGADIVDEDLDAILAELASDDLVSVVDTSDIPADWFRALSDIIADRVRLSFPLVPPDTLARVEKEGEDAVQTLRRTTRGRPSYNRAVPEWI